MEKEPTSTDTLTPEVIQAHIEALIFAAQQSVRIAEIQECFEKAFEVQLTEGAVQKCIHQITEKHDQSDSINELVRINGGYQFMTKKEYHPTISTFLQQKSKKRLSRAAMETLAIIAYRQPVTKVEIVHKPGAGTIE